MHWSALRVDLASQVMNSADRSPREDGGQKLKNAYFHCIGGASGDMILGAVIDAGVPIETIQEALDAMKVRGAELTCKEAQRGGLHGKLVDVELDERAKRPRAWQDFVRTVEESDLSPNVKQRATTVFERLAEAEARVHKTTIEGVHLRELGTLDTLVDVVGGIVGLEALGIERLYSSPFPTGSGVINSEQTGEMVTPTGAAIITTLATFRQPAMTLETVGYGLGQRESRDYPNVLALWIGQEHGASYNEDLTLIETNVDDMTGEVLGFVQERLFEAGALDVWFTPIQMKKNRPATMVSVIVGKTSEPDAIAMLMKETTTLGVRTRPLTRYEADREIAEANTQFGKVAVKVKRLEGVAVAAAPEYEDCRRIAMEHDLPLQTVYRLIAKDAESQLLD